MTDPKLTRAQILNRLMQSTVERIRGEARRDRMTYKRHAQIGGAAPASTGGSVGGGSGPNTGNVDDEPGDFIVIEQISLTVAASGGTAHYDFGDVGDIEGVHGWITALRDSPVTYHAKGGFSAGHVAGSSPFVGWEAVVSGRAVRAADGGALNYAASIVSSQLRLTFTNNHATEDYLIMIQFTESEVAS